MDTFTCDWREENNWYCLPVHLIPCLLKHAEATKAEGTLVVPQWVSAHRFGHCCSLMGGNPLNLLNRWLNFLIVITCSCQASQVFSLGYAPQFLLNCYIQLISNMNVVIAWRAGMYDRILVTGCKQYFRMFLAYKEAYLIW